MHLRSHPHIMNTSMPAECYINVSVAGSSITTAVHLHEQHVTLGKAHLLK